MKMRRNVNMGFGLEGKEIETEIEKKIEKILNYLL